MCWTFCLALLSYVSVLVDAFIQHRQTLHFGAIAISERHLPEACFGKNGHVQLVISQCMQARYFISTSVSLYIHFWSHSYSYLEEYMLHMFFCCHWGSRAGDWCWENCGQGYLSLQTNYNKEDTPVQQVIALVYRKEGYPRPTPTFVKGQILQKAIAPALGKKLASSLFFVIFVHLWHRWVLVNFRRRAIHHSWFLSAAHLPASWKGFSARPNSAWERQENNTK